MLMQGYAINQLLFATQILYTSLKKKYNRYLKEAGRSLQAC